MPEFLFSPSFIPEDSEFMDYFSQFDDCILQAILSRLPGRSIGQAKCTSKRWRDLISSPLFITTQATRSVNNALGILSATSHPCGGQLLFIPFDTSSEAPDTSLGLPYPKAGQISILADCNGLLFCKRNNPGMIHHDYILGNPAIRSFKCICNPPTDHPWNTKYGLAFDPATPPASLKLVACTGTWNSLQGPHFKFDVYSLQTDKWATSSAIMPCMDRDMFDLARSVYYNGVLHWLRGTGDEILAFNVGEERAYRLSLPHGVRASTIGGGYTDVWLGVAAGKMIVVMLNKGIHVWETDKYSSSGRWEPKKTVEMDAECCYYCERNVPVFCDGDKCVMLSWDTECGLAVYRFREAKWDPFRKLQGWMDTCRHFVPYISHMADVRINRMIFC